jgi:hypothetical protein
LETHLGYFYHADSLYTLALRENFLYDATTFMSHGRARRCHRARRIRGGYIRTYTKPPIRFGRELEDIESGGRHHTTLRARITSQVKRRQSWTE